jgi:NAD(P)H-hydrate epimerase
MLERLLTRQSEAPIVLDADALNILATMATEASKPSAAVLSALMRGRRQVVCTPHPGEFTRLLNEELPSDFAGRVERVQSFAMTSGSTVLLKGTPTVICTGDGAPPVCVARGTAALSTGGSGDMLTGIITTLLSQGVPGGPAAILGAWLHGRAAEIATTEMRTSRGISLDRIGELVPAAWREVEQPANFQPSLLAELPSVLSLSG